MKKTQGEAIAVLLAVMIVSSMFAAFAISPASSGEVSGEVKTNLAPTIEYITDEGSTYREYKGYANETKHRYTWEGDTIKLNVKVTDGNGLGDIESVELYIDDISRTCEVTNTTIDNTSAYYMLTYTVQNVSLLHGEYSPKVRVTDKSGSFADTGTNISKVWFNPVVSICTTGSVNYDPGDPGNITQADDSGINSSSDCGLAIYGSNRDVCIDGTCYQDDESSDYNWTTRVKNAAEGNVFQELKISSTDMTGDHKGGTIPVSNQHFYMNSSRSTTMGDTPLTDTPDPVASELGPAECCYFDFYLKYPAVPKDTYSGEISFTSMPV